MNISQGLYSIGTTCQNYRLVSVINIAKFLVELLQTKFRKLQKQENVLWAKEVYPQES